MVMRHLTHGTFVRITEGNVKVLSIGPNITQALETLVIMITIITLLF